MEENEVNSFTFYRDYYYLIDTMPIEDKKLLAVAILDYVFKDEIPNLNGHNQAIFNTLSKQLNLSKNNSKRATGKKPEENQKETGKEPEVLPEKSKTSILSFKFYISNFKFINNNLELINKLEEWFKYKQQRKDKYTEIGIKSLLKRIDNSIKDYGIEKVISLIDECMANNYKGIIFEKLEKEEKPTYKSAYERTKENLAKARKEIEARECRASK